jgi:O-antigen/teichoic acid export membrane protein
VAVVGQAVASGSNLVMTALAARELSAVEFGAFGVVYALNIVLTGVARSLIGEPALVRVAGSSDVAPDVYASGTFFGVVSGLAVAAAGALIGGSSGTALIAFGVVLPGMVLQDLGRHLAFALHRPDKAALLDVIWAVLQVGGIAALVILTDASPAAIVLVWGGTGTIVGLLAVVMSRCSIPWPSLGWIQASWGFSWRYLLGFAATAGALQVTTLVLGSVVGVAAVGSVRGAQIVLGPLIPLYAGVSAVLVPEGARSQRDAAQFRHQLILMSGLMAVAGAVLTAGGLVLPDGIGREILGDSWASARDVLLPAGLASILSGATAGAVIGLRASRAVRTTLAVQLRLVPVQLLLPIAGAVWGGTGGFMWTTAAAAFVAACVWWQQGLRPLGSLP